MAIHYELDGKKYFMGCNRDPPHEDARMLLTPEEAEALPVSVILNDKTPIEDQGNEGSCTSFAWNGAQMLRDFLVSGQYMIGAHQQFYRCETAADGNPGEDVGSSLSQGANIYKTVGFAPESMYPYSEPLNQAVPQSVLDAAKKDEGTVLTRLDSSNGSVTITNIKTALASAYPVALGFTVFESFFGTGSNGNMPSPSGGVAGGHAVCCVGYDDNHTGNYDGSKGAFKFRNSWGTGWGAGGYWWMPYNYFLGPDDGVGDCWAVVSENDFPTPPPPANVTVASAPATCTQDEKVVDLFVIGTDKACWWKHSTAAWVSLGGVCTSVPAAVARGVGTMDVFVRGSDGAPYQKTYTNGTWGAWHLMTGLIEINTAPSACVVSGNLTLFVIGTDGNLYQNIEKGTVWQKWVNLGKNL
jgi:hypothetical protein